jgi:hypothetical protein
VRHSILKVVGDARDVTNAVVLTHNIDFVFLENVVVRALRKCGRPKLTVFADAGCAEESYEYQKQLLSGLGLQYRVVPVAMASHFRFHPKALFLSSPEKATLLIGSGNLTFGGWSENVEVWHQMDTTRDGTGFVAAFRDYLSALLSDLPLRGSIEAELSEAFDPGTRSWASSLDAPSTLFSKGNGDTLLERMCAHVGIDGVRHLTVCSPYFDPQAEALGAIIRKCNAAQATILVQKGQAGLTKDTASRLPRNVTIQAFTSERKCGDATRKVFTHSKFYAFEKGRKVVVFVGSANCSRAALTIPGPAGNAELVAVEELTPAEFHDRYMSEFNSVGGKECLPESLEKEHERNDLHIRLLAARNEAGYLSLGYTCTNGAKVNGCTIDGEERALAATGTKEARTRVGSLAQQVALLGSYRGAKVQSNTLWIDHEQILNASARERTLAAVVGASAKTGHWDVGVWSGIMEVFCAHLRYLAIDSTMKRISGTSSDQEEKETVSYSAQDVFATSYGLGTPSAKYHLHGGKSVMDPLQLLDSNFSHIYREDDEPANTGRNSAAVSSQDSGEEEPVDLPEEDVPQPPSIQPVAPTEKERRRVSRLIDFMTAAMCDEEFLSERGPERLAIDLRLAAALLVCALNHGWIKEATFVDSTHAIWSSLFLTSDSDRTKGWIEQREETDGPSFARRMSSPELSAAMAAWALAIPKGDMSPERARFALTLALSAARAPWIWHGGELLALAEELARFLASTGSSVASEGDAWLQKEAQWLRVVRRGHALRRLEHALAGRAVGAISLAISGDHVKSGELLWQGSLGFCVASAPFSRGQSSRAPVLPLQSSSDAKLRGSLTVPIRMLLDLSGNKALAPLSNDERSEIYSMIDELSSVRWDIARFDD